MCVPAEGQVCGTQSVACRHVSPTRAARTNEGAYASVHRVPGNWYPYDERTNVTSDFASPTS